MLPDDELWARLRRFDRWCDISFLRINAAKSCWSNHRRIWEVRIFPRHVRAHPEFLSIYGRDPDLSFAVRQAVDLAEQRGWHQGKNLPTQRS